MGSTFKIEGTIRNKSRNAPAVFEQGFTRKKI